MTVWDIRGQPQVGAALRGAVERGEISHAWAFTGPSGVGQDQSAVALTAALNCEAPAAPCGSCAVCVRALRGAHPAYWEFAPRGSMHRVAEVRGEWLPVAFRTAVEGAWKVLRILEADRMNEAAANAFLKALEEPPDRTVWILDVTDSDALPDTILSRCREVRFTPWDATALEAEAETLGITQGPERCLAVRACTGSPVRLRALAAPHALDDVRAHREIPRRLRREGPAFALVAARALDEEVKRRTAALKGQGKAELAELQAVYVDSPPRGVAKQVEDRLARREREARLAVTQAALDDLLAWYRDLLFVGAGGDPAAAVHGDDSEGLVDDAKQLSPSAVVASAELVLRARDDLELNVQQGLALEALLIDLSVLALSSGEGGVDLAQRSPARTARGRRAG